MNSLVELFTSAHLLVFKICHSVQLERKKRNPLKGEFLSLVGLLHGGKEGG